jgi:uncharacterized protein with beta-barrel porin domain
MSFADLTFRRWLTAAIVMAIFSIQSGAKAQELISNPSFETGCSTLSTTCPPWSFTGSGQIATLPHTGTLSAIVNFSGGTGSVGQTVALTRLGVYQFSFWYNTWNCCNLQATASVGGQTVFNQSLSLGIPTTQFTAQVMLNAGAAEVLFTATSGGNGAINGAINIDDVSLTFLRALLLRDLLPAGGSVNQTNTMSAIDKFTENGGTLPSGVFALYGLTGNALLNALSQASGEAGASVAPSTFQAWNQFYNMIFDPFAPNRGFAPGGGAMPFAAEGAQPSNATRLAYAAVTPRDRRGVVDDAFPYGATGERWSVWGGGYGGRATTGGNTTLGSHDTTSQTYGIAAGAERKVTPDTLFGFALAGGGTNFSLGNALGGGRSDLFQAAAYARQTWSAAYLMGALGYGWQDVATNRVVTTDTLDASFNANTFTGRAEGGWRFGTTTTGVTPYAAVQVISIGLPGYNEHATAGSNSFALAYDKRWETQTRSEFGARFDHAIFVQDGRLTLHGRTAWAHNYSETNIATATFLSLPGASFTVNGARPDADSLLMSAGAEFAWRNGFSLAGTFEGEFANNTESYAGKGTLRYRW